MKKKKIFNNLNHNKLLTTTENHVTLIKQIRKNSNKKNPKRTIIFNFIILIRKNVFSDLQKKNYVIWFLNKYSTFI